VSFVFSVLKSVEMSGTVRVRKEVLARLQQEALRVPGEECCGLLAGRDGVITQMFPAANALASATAYEIAPLELFSNLREMRAAGLELLGIYHSHPAGENRPSMRDIERAFYPDAAYFILSPLPTASQPVRAFSIRDGRAAELDMEVL
jgi:[CysO sulfur-carrier protein]-S-L-cysteine hydrolase